MIIAFTVGLAPKNPERTDAMKILLAVDGSDYGKAAADAEK
jgi:hypothetical protein